jgi:hypothetical protein
MDLGDFAVTVSCQQVTDHRVTVALVAVDDPQTICCVCQERDVATAMPCGHGVHLACLQPWLRQADTCPVCRAPLPLECTMTWSHNGPLPERVFQVPPYLVEDLDDDGMDDVDDEDDDGPPPELLRRHLLQPDGPAGPEPEDGEWGANHGVVVYASNTARVTVNMRR